jgi:2-polyprenyl-3-methyl-5-hydroxy-6-metoxy-1,4-benzoquinol methylase
VAYAAIWDELARQFGAAFSADVLRRHAPSETTTLTACGHCGLEYFVPKVAGDDDFYAELMAAATYEPDRWEFALVGRRLPPGAHVLDVGCGSGAFLRSVRGRTARVVGVDRNPTVQEQLAAEDIPVHPALDEVADAMPGAFDAVCAFQLLEHVPDVASIVEATRTCLSPDGRFFVAVPNAERARGSGLEPLDCPPHHISRWRPQQARMLAERFDLELVRVDLEPALWHGLETRLARIARALGPRASRMVVPVMHTATAETAIRLAASLLRPGVAGHSMLFEYRRA